MTAAPKRTVVWRNGTSRTDRPPAPGKHRCATCHREVTLRGNGDVRSHSDGRLPGQSCPGSGARIEPAEPLRLTELPPVVFRGKPVENPQTSTAKGES